MATTYGLLAALIQNKYLQAIFHVVNQIEFHFVAPPPNGQYGGLNESMLK